MKAVFDQFKNRYIGVNKPAKAAIWISFSNIFLKGLAFVSAPIFTRIMTEADYGMSTLLVSYEQLFLIIATWEIQLGAYQKGIVRYKDDIGRFTNSLQILINLLTTICFLVLFLFRNWVFRITGLNEACMLILYIAFMAQPAYYFWITRKRNEFEYKNIVLISILYGTLSIGASLIAVLFVSNTGKSKFMASVLITAIVCAFFYISDLIKNFSLGTATKYWGYALRFQAPLVLHSFSYLVLAQADKVMIGKYLGNEEVALYSVAYSVASILLLFNKSVNQSLMPWMYNSYENGEFEDVKKTTVRILEGFACGILVFVLIVPEFFLILFPKGYHEALWCIPPIALSSFFMLLYSIFVNFESYYEKTKYVMYASVFCAACNIVMNYYSIKFWGYISCAYTTLISYIMFAFIHYMFVEIVRKKAGLSQRAFDIRKLVLISLILIVATLITAIMYEHVAFRYALLTICIGVWVYHKHNASGKTS